MNAAGSLTEQNITRVPADLRERPQWVGWRAEQRDGKPTKVPYNARTGARASSTDPSTWSTFAEAQHACGSGQYDGIGFVVADADPFTGIDLDNCRNPETGELQPWAQRIVERTNSYTEISPSGRGLHVFVVGTLPHGGRTTPIEDGKIELYDDTRYFTIAGDHLPETPQTIERRQVQLEALHAELFGHRAKQKTPHVTVTPVEMTDDEAQAILDRARDAKNGHKVRKLWEGRWQELDYGSQSEADLALASSLYFWAGGDLGKVDALFRRSRLYRPKWDEVHYSDKSTYGQHTLAQCVGGETYQGDGARIARPIELKVRTWKQMREDPLPPPRMLVAHLFLAKNIGMTAGPTYVGKSTAALDLAVSVAAGIPAFDHFPVTEQSPVIYVYAEQGANLWERRLFEVARARGVADRNLPISMVAGYDLRLSEPNHLDAVIRVVKGQKAGLILLDPLAALFSVDDENEVAQVVRAVRQPLQRLIEETDVTPVVVHHSTKRAHDFEPSNAQELVRGSSDLIAMTGSILGLWFSNKHKAIKAVVNGRFTAPPPFRLRKGTPKTTIIDFDDSGISPLTWDGEWEKPEDKARPTLESIRAIHAKTRQVVTQPQISKDTGQSRSTVFRHADELIERKLIAKVPGEGWLPVGKTEAA